MKGKGMTFAFMTVALLAITAIAIFLLREVDRHVRRRRQLDYLQGPLRHQLACLADEEADRWDDVSPMWLDSPSRPSATRRVLPR